MRVVDIFPFFNELDVLELRLRELETVVDLHVAVQCRETHSGLPKPIVLDPAEARWAPWRDRLKSVEVTPLTNPASRWDREHQPRHVIPLLLDSYQIDQDDLVLMSDVDEIPSAALLREHGPRVSRRHWIGFLATCYYYYLNLRVPRPHKCIALAKASRVRELGGQAFRDKAFAPPIGPVPGGWHFSYLGGVDAIRTKLAAFAHAEFDTDEVKDPARLARAIAERRSFFPTHVGRAKPEHSGQFTQVPLTELPEDVRVHPERYAQHLLQPWA